MTKRLLGVDVDMTVCPSDVGWYSWLQKQGQQMYKLGDYEPTPYNLGELFPTIIDPHQYWREVDYNQFSPIKGSVEALEKLSNYFGIVFISRIKGNHTKSKYYWLKENFPFMTEYVATHGKWVMDKSIEAMVDDRLDVLEKFDYNKRVLFETSYTQSSDCGVALSFNTWNDNIVKRICEEYL